MDLQPLSENPDLKTEENSDSKRQDAASLRTQFLHMGEVIKDFVKQNHKSETISSAIRLRDSLVLGRYCIKHQKLARKLDVNWQKWLKESIPHYSQKSISDFMQLAKVPKIEKYIILGKARLMALLPYIDEDENDPIGTILSEMGIRFNPEDAITYEVFKDAVDLIIIMRKIRREEITGVEIELVKLLMSKNLVTSRLISELKYVHGTCQ